MTKAATVRRIAGSSTLELLRQQSFWRSNLGFLGVIATALLSVVLLLPYTYAPAGGWELLSLAVHAFGVWAAMIAARSLATLEIENALVHEIENNGTAHLRDVKAGRRARVDLDQLEQTVVPNNPSQPPPAMIRLFQHIIKEARDRRFDSSVNVMQPYREEPLEDLFRLQNLQKIALWLGILGTFIGLLLAIGAADLKQRDFLKIVQDMFGGLAISFSASLAGLQVAVFIGVLLLLLRKRQERYFKKMEAAVVTMLSLARHAINKDDFLAEFSQITTTIDALTNKVHEQTAESSTRMEATRQTVEAQTDAIREGMIRLQEARGNFDGFLNSLGESQSQFIEEIRGVYDTLSLKALSETLHESLEQAGWAMADTLSTGSREVARRMGEFNTMVDVLRDAFETHTEQTAQQSKRIAAQLQGAMTETANAMKLTATRMQDILQREISVRNELAELSRNVAMLSRSLDRLDRLAPPRPRSVREVLASFRW